MHMLDISCSTEKTDANALTSGSESFMHDAGAHAHTYQSAPVPSVDQGGTERQRHKQPVSAIRGFARLLAAREAHAARRAVRTDQHAHNGCARLYRRALPQCSLWRAYARWSILHGILTVCIPAHPANIDGLCKYTEATPSGPAQALHQIDRNAEAAAHVQAGRVLEFACASWLVTVPMPPRTTIQVPSAPGSRHWRARQQGASAWQFCIAGTTTHLGCKAANDLLLQTTQLLSRAHEGLVDSM